MHQGDEQRNEECGFQIVGYGLQYPETSFQHHQRMMDEEDKNRCCEPVRQQVV